MQLLIIGLLCLIALGRVKHGWRKGMVDEIFSLLHIGIGLISLFCIVLLYNAYQNQNHTTLVVMVILLVVLGVVFKLTKVALAPLTGLKKLSLVRVIDGLLGAVIGLGEGILIAYTINKILEMLGRGPIL